MGNTERPYPLFSLCGLNCGLCPNHYTNGPSRCSGCGSGAGFFNPSCGIIACAERHGGLEFCFQCPEYPCPRYEGADLYDSFITHRKQLEDNEKAKTRGMDVYRAELGQKIEILQTLLAQYNDGRRKSFFCLSVNLLELPELEALMARLADETQAEGLSLREKSGTAVRLLGELADSRDIVLQLNKKTPKKPEPPL